MIRPRIVEGKYKNKKLEVPNVSRPITDRVKIQLFDLIKELTKEAKILDLFAGSGNFGIEALSRGASHVTFVEIDKDATLIIKRNLNSLKIEKEKYQIVKTLSTGKFDIIFIDPPFNKSETLNLKRTQALIKETGIIIFRVKSSSFNKIAIPKSLQIIYTKKIGISMLIFLKNS